MSREYCVFRYNGPCLPEEIVEYHNTEKEAEEGASRWNRDLGLLAGVPCLYCWGKTSGVRREGSDD